jgi:hypothetical protein
MWNLQQLLSNIRLDIAIFNLPATTVWRQRL